MLRRETPSVRWRLTFSFKHLTAKNAWFRYFPPNYAWITQISDPRNYLVSLPHQFESPQKIADQTVQPLPWKTKTDTHTWRNDVEMNRMPYQCSNRCHIHSSLSVLSFQSYTNILWCLHTKSYRWFLDYVLLFFHCICRHTFRYLKDLVWFFQNHHNLCTTALLTDCMLYLKGNGVKIRKFDQKVYTRQTLFSPSAFAKVSTRETLYP